MSGTGETEWQPVGVPLSTRCTWVSGQCYPGMTLVLHYTSQVYLY